MQVKVVYGTRCDECGEKSPKIGKHKISVASQLITLCPGCLFRFTSALNGSDECQENDHA
jgi:hypothetical protein